MSFTDPFDVITGQHLFNNGTNYSSVNFPGRYLFSLKDSKENDDISTSIQNYPVHHKPHNASLQGTNINYQIEKNFDYKHKSSFLESNLDSNFKLDTASSQFQPKQEVTISSKTSLTDSNTIFSSRHWVFEETFSEAKLREKTLLNQKYQGTKRKQTLNNTDRNFLSRHLLSEKFKSKLSGTTFASISKLKSKSKWPKLLWINTHAPGQLKSPKFIHQTAAGVKDYNDRIKWYLDQYDIPVMETFNMTDGLHAVDGTHYGFGANMLKVQFLLHWIKEQIENNNW